MMHRNHPVADYASVVDDDTQFVDVRQPDEVAAGSIDGSVNIPLDQLVSRLHELNPLRRTVVVCRSGGRSTRAAEFLTAAGFVDVVNLDGGILAHRLEPQGDNG